MNIHFFLSQYFSGHMSLILKLIISFYLLWLEFKKHSNHLKTHVTAFGPHRGAAFSTRKQIKGRKRIKRGRAQSWGRQLNKTANSIQKCSSETSPQESWSETYSLFIFLVEAEKSSHFNSLRILNIILRSDRLNHC